MQDLRSITRQPRGPELRTPFRILAERKTACTPHTLHEGGDDGTNDLLVSSVIRTNEIIQVWFLGEHLAEQPTPR